MQLEGDTSQEPLQKATRVVSHIGESTRGSTPSDTFCLGKKL